MKIWLDAQLSPGIAKWLTEVQGIATTAVRDMGLLAAKDREIFFAAREANVLLLTKDSDFIHLLAQHGPPPRILWLTCGNTSNEHLRQVLDTALPKALALIEAGEMLVEIAGN